MTLPIWIRDGKNERPDAPAYYELAANGFFIHKKMSYWTATVPVKRISILEPEIPSLEVSLPPIPIELTKEIAQFLAWVHHTRGTEAVLLLWLNEETNMYRLEAPVQDTSGGGVKYKFPLRQPPEVLIGSFHSHGSLGAFHSSTDTCDEKSFDGLHGTLGGFSGFRNVYNDFEVSLQMAINGTRFAVEPSYYMEGLSPTNDRRPLIEKPELVNPERSSRDYYDYDFFRRARRFSLDDHDVVLLEKEYAPPEEWIGRIQRPTSKPVPKKYPAEMPLIPEEAACGVVVKADLATDQDQTVSDAKDTTEATASPPKEIEDAKSKIQSAIPVLAEKVSGWWHAVQKHVQEDILRRES